MGLVLADALTARGVPARLWGPFATDIERLASSRRSPERLKDFVLPQPVLTHVLDATGDPFGVLLDRGRHVRQDGRTAGTGDREEIGEAGNL